MNSQKSIQLAHCPNIGPFRFLQDPSSTLELNLREAQQQHSISTITCLLSSVRLLGDDLPKSYGLLLKGVYSLLLYAAEYWTDCILTVVEIEKGLQTQPHLLSLVSRLMTELDSSRIEEHEIVEEPFDLRLEHLRDHGSIREFICRDMLRGSLKQFEEDLKRERSEFAVLIAYFVRSC